MGRGGAKGGLRITKKEMVQVLLKRIKQDIHDINLIIEEESAELKKKLPLIIGLSSLVVADILDDGVLNGSILVQIGELL
jgi:hypothetical protein